MVQTRLRELREEFARGRDEMTRLEQRRAELHAAMLRISGAIQVLEELGAAAPAAEPAGQSAPLAAAS